MPSGLNTENILNILIATDIHLGYGEKHPVKAEDSFNTFAEILDLALERKVDMVLLGGDLFHENKPSRSCEMKALNILRNRVMGDRPVSIELVSDPSVNFTSKLCDGANYEDPNLNISLPIFSIHGNHDDPCGLGGYSCLDLLHSTGLVNYFGRADNLSEVRMSPVLIKKGRTKLALYGLGALKDERLHRLFRQNQVHMLRPSEDTDGWFNLLVLHQNRVKHGATNYIPEHFIEEFVHLTLWGHEHECRLAPEEIVNGDKQVFITQPGSSVATSLIAGEAKPKMVGLLQIHGCDFKIDEIPLKTVRPFIFRNVVLDDSSVARSFNGTTKQVRDRVEDYLKNYVEEMLIEADALFTGHPQQPLLPQLRLRVEYSNEDHQLTPARFGNAFHDRVANPNDILLFRKRVMAKKNSDASANVANDLMEELMEGGGGSSMEDLIAQYFSSDSSKDSSTCLKLLGIKGVAAAVKNFIEKEDKDAIGLIVDKQIEKTYQKLMARMVGSNDDCQENYIGDVLDEIRQERHDQQRGDDADVVPKVPSHLHQKKVLESDNEKDDDDDDDELDEKNNKKTTLRVEETARSYRGRRGTQRGTRGRRGSKMVPAASTNIQDSIAKMSRSSNTRNKRGAYMFESDSD